MRSRLLLLAVLLAAAGAAAQENAPAGNGPERITRPAPARKPPPVNMVVHLGQEGYARRDAVVPIRVVLDNGGSPHSGRLVLRVGGRTTETPVELPRGAHKEYTLFVPAWPLEQEEAGYGTSPYAGHEPPVEGELSLYSGRSRIAMQAVKPEFPDEEALILSATGDGSGLQFLNEEKASRYGEEGRKFRVAHSSPQDLPRQWAGYAAADVVALNGRAWSAMDDEQRRALRIWIEGGGRAVLAGEATTEWRDPEAEALTGVTPRELASHPVLNAVAAWGGSPYRAVQGSLLTVSGPLQPGTQTLFEEGGKSLIVLRQAGFGQVLWIGFDPFRQTVREWPGYSRFWRAALARVRKDVLMGGTGSLADMPEAVEAASALPRLPAPPLPVIIGFGVLYAMIFGPLNVWMLRRLRRTVRAWLFVPALALGMTLLVLAVGQAWGKGRTVLNSLTMLHTTRGSRTASETSLAGLFSPTNAAFDLTADDPAPSLRDRGAPGGESPPEGDGTAVAPWPDHQADGSVRWNRVALQLYSVRLMELSRPRDLGGAVEIRLQGAGPTPGGTVRNGTTLTLQGACLVSGKRYHPLGELKPGGTVRVMAAGWTTKRPPPPDMAGSSAGLLENERFRASLAKVWELSLTRTGGEKWLVAGCEGYRGGFEVEGAPFNNRAALIRVYSPARSEE